MATAWKNFKATVKEKRIGKSTSKGATGKIVENQAITVQRLSSEVAGKAQKYSRLGPREFVAYEYDEVSLENIRRACEQHFAPQLGGNLHCDVLAGEQGPSCKCLEHVPDFKVLHVRFVEDLPSEADGNSHTTKQPAKRRRLLPAKASGSEPITVVDLANSAQSAISYPKSLSVVEMMKLGKVISQKSTTPINVSSFDLVKMAWSGKETVVYFSIEKESVGTGAFREAFKAKSVTQGFASSTWVVKKYLPTALDVIEATNQTVEQHTRKVVQMHMLARNFEAKLHEELEKKDVHDLYGEALKYNMVYFGRMADSGEFVTVEEFIEGKFQKYMNNTGEMCKTVSASVPAQKAESLAHFSYEKSEHKLLVVDMQGSGNHLCDPEIASQDLYSHDIDNEFLFSAGNLTYNAINTFTETHKCNTYCRLLDLKEL